MKKTKALVTLFLILAISIIPLLKVEAHSIDLDPSSLINFPAMIFDGKGTITVKSTETGYTLYYQAVEVPNATYSQMETIRNDGETKLNVIETEMDKLDTECDNLKTIYDEAYDAYKAKFDSGETDAELETLKTAYETAKTNYQNKGKEYNEKVKEYNAKVNEVNSKVKELTPSYVETNWTKTEDRSFNVSLSEFSGDKAFTIWVKLVSSDGTISYDEAIYEMSGTKVNVKSVSLDKATISIAEGSSYTLTATINPADATNKVLTWSSSNENVAKVENGKVTGIAEGTATITVTAKDGNYKATCNVTVSKKVVTPSKDDEETDPIHGEKVDEIKVKSVSLDKTTISVTEGSNYTLTATINPTDATNKLLTWSSSNEKVAKVENGKITGIAEGTATITVTTEDGNYKATCNVTVSKKVTVPSTTEDKKEENPPKKETIKSDDTTAKGKIPQTGSSSFYIISAIILTSILGIVFFKKVKYMNF